MKPSRSTLVLATVATAAALAPASAHAASPASGAFRIALPASSKVTKGLKAQRITLAAVRPATGRTVISLPIKRVSTAQTATFRLAGGIRLKRGKRKVALSSLIVSVRGSSLTVTARLGKTRTAMFTARTGQAAKVDRSAGTASASGSDLKLTKRGSTRIGKALGVRRVRWGTLGGVALRGRWTPATRPSAGPEAGTGTGTAPSTDTPAATPAPVGPDPYRTICPVGAVSGPGARPGSTPAPAPAAALPARPAAGSDVTAGSATWGFKQSFRSYLRTIAAGTITAQGEGATVDASGVATYTVRSGWLGGTNPLFDSVLAQGRGTVLFCSVAHGFWYSFSDPAVVIAPGISDGRIVVTVDSNQSGNYIGPKRVDFATVALDRVVPTTVGSDTTWTDVPTTMAAGGAQYFSDYPAGTALDPVTVKATR